MVSKKDIQFLDFASEWYLPTKEVQARKKFIDEAISYWVDKGIVTKDYFKNRAFKVFLRVLPQLKPITLEMIDDFILGLILLPYPKYEDEVNNYLKPSCDMVVKYYYTDTIRHGMIDRNVPKNDMMFIDGWDIKNTRAALKEAVQKDKFTLPYNKEKIDRLKVEYKEQQKKIYQEIQQELSQPPVTGFECKLPKETVEEIFNLIVKKKIITGNLNDFFAIFGIASYQFKNPIIWLITAEKGRNAGHGHKEELRNFLVEILGKVTAEDERKVPFLFVDKNGNKMTLTKSKGKKTIDFKAIINKAKRESAFKKHVNPSPTDGPVE
jgi:hypothetical protein